MAVIRVAVKGSIPLVVPREALALNPPALKTFLTLWASIQSDDDEVDLTREVIAQKVGIERTTLWRHLKEIAELGLLVLDETASKVELLGWRAYPEDNVATLQHGLIREEQEEEKEEEKKDPDTLLRRVSGGRSAPVVQEVFSTAPTKAQRSVSLIDLCKSGEGDWEKVNTNTLLDYMRQKYFEAFSAPMQHPTNMTRGKWKRMMSEFGQEAVVRMIEYVVMEWDVVKGNYSLQGHPGYDLIFGYRTSFVTDSQNGAGAETRKMAHDTQGGDKEDTAQAELASAGMQIEEG